MATDRRRRLMRWWAGGWAATLFLVMSGVTILTLFVWARDRASAQTSPVTDLAFYALGSMIAVGFAVQVRSPEENTAGALQAGLASASLALAGLIGDRIEPLVGGLVLMAAVGALFALDPHPRSAFRAEPDPRIPPVVMAALAGIPTLVYANRMFTEAADAGPSCFLGRCATGDRLAEIGAAALATVLLAALAGSRLPGWRVPMWMASATAVLIGSLSLWFPAEPGTVGSGGALGAIA